MKKMGKRIKSKRIELGMSQEQLGEKLGVQKSTISKWEKAEVEHIKRTYITQMAGIFGVSVSWLMGLDEAAEVTLTYTAPDHEPVTTTVDGNPILGPEALRGELYRAALNVKPENYAVAIDLLKSLS